jgi:hypothetical protein
MKIGDRNLQRADDFTAGKSLNTLPSYLILFLPIKPRQDPEPKTIRSNQEPKDIPDWHRLNYNMGTLTQVNGNGF